MEYIKTFFHDKNRLQIQKEDARIETSQNDRKYVRESKILLSIGKDGNVTAFLLTPSEAAHISVILKELVKEDLQKQKELHKEIAENKGGQDVLP